MPVLGHMVVGGCKVPGEGTAFAAVEAATGQLLEPQFQTASPAQIEAALSAADAASAGFGASAPAARAALLEAIGEAILEIGDDLIERAMAETGLPRPRVEGERMRTVNQLRMFATHLREGDFARVRVDRGDPGRTSGPKPDLRFHLEALGPVAVFGASNFPLAFSVAGGDTTSALAAGCPVIVKGHPAHPGTAELVASAILQAVVALDFPPGIFALLHDSGISVGEALVADRRIKAVGFTGSRRAGEALIAIASRRAEPIPVYAEMSAVNPVVLCPAKLSDDAERIAAAFVGSLTLGAGQFCTNPGLVLTVDGPDSDRFAMATAGAIEACAPAVMLTPGICDAFATSTARVAAQDGVAAIGSGQRQDARATAQLFSVSAASYLANPVLHQEMFGPAAILVRCRDAVQLAEVLERIEGQLTIALHFNEADHALVGDLLPIARRKAGRVLANGFGTGVEVSPAMVHGGPYPATSDSRTTSVGTLAIERFLRPVCLQDFPEALLPAAVSSADPWQLPRRIW